jgi:periplasmic protein TonB
MKRQPETDSLRPRLVRSAMVHAIGLLALAGYSYLQGRVDSFGDPNINGGGSVMIQPVNSIPIPSPRGPVQPVANDTQSQVPEPPKPEKVKPQVKKPPPPDPDAISLRSKKKDSPKKVEPAPTRVTKQPEPINQVYSQSGARTSSPMFTVQGSGGVGLGESNPFGNRFGYYAAAVRQQVARNWRTGDIALNTAPSVIVTFDVKRDGSVSNVKVAQSSGNAQLDRSCQRAVIDASPLPPLPAGFERDSANIEFWFQLKR